MGVLQLDVTMRPVDLISVEDAVAKIVTGSAQAIASDESVLYRGPYFGEEMRPHIPDYLVRDGRVVVPRPQIIQFREYVELKPHKTKNVVRRVLYARDNWTCQYCGTQLDRRSATVDHVKPLSRGGDWTWENCTTACRPCNHRKSNRLPYECHMYPKTTPKAPSYVQTVWAGRLEPIQKEYVAQYFKVEVEKL